MGEPNDLSSNGGEDYLQLPSVWSGLWNDSPGQQSLSVFRFSRSYICEWERRYDSIATLSDITGDSIPDYATTYREAGNTYLLTSNGATGQPIKRIVLVNAGLCLPKRLVRRRLRPALAQQRHGCHPSSRRSHVSSDGNYQPSLTTTGARAHTPAPQRKNRSTMLDPSFVQQNACIPNSSASSSNAATPRTVLPLASSRGE